MRLLKLLATVGALAVASPAAAATSFGFSFNSGYGAGVGSFTTASDASAGFAQIVTLSGTLNGAAISLLAPGTYPGSALNDNLFQETSPFFTFGGLSFASGGQNYNLYSQSGTVRFCGRTPSCEVTSITNFRVAAVPEPGTWMMMLVGFFAVGVGVRRAARARTLATA